MGRYLDSIRNTSRYIEKKSEVITHNRTETSSSVSSVTKQTKETNPAGAYSSSYGTKETKETKEGADLEARLIQHGISIAIDKATGSALLVFTASDAQAVCHVADVHKPFSVTLTASQTAELAEDLGYYECLLEGRKRMGKSAETRTQEHP